MVMEPFGFCEHLNESMDMAAMAPNNVCVIPSHTLNNRFGSIAIRDRLTHLKKEVDKKSNPKQQPAKPMGVMHLMSMEAERVLNPAQLGLKTTINSEKRQNPA
jgi:hypothetical protein